MKPAVITKVSVAGGSKIGVSAKNNQFSWNFQGTSFQVDVMVIPLGGCDMVLGVQWLETLGPITWDFKKLEMQFKLGHKNIILHGIKQGSVREMKAAKLNKLTEDQVQLAMIYAQTSVEEDQMMLCSVEAVNTTNQLIQL